ncbi:MAG: SRPBCC domain-containing protein [Ferruginibacter sp.]
MTNTFSAAQNGKAITSKKIFSRQTSVSTSIRADASIIWALLTNAVDFSRWNSTVISVEGNIAPGETIRLRSVLDAKRLFKLKVKEFVPGQKLTWGDTMGKRDYLLENGPGGTTLFSMTEKIGGPLFPLFAKMIPSFDRSFEQFAADLKKEAESIMNAR